MLHDKAAFDEFYKVIKNLPEDIISIKRILKLSNSDLARQFNTTRVQIWRYQKRKCTPNIMVAIMLHKTAEDLRNASSR
jgi:hypothetical protein